MNVVALSSTGEALIKCFETFQSLAYKPTANDKWTIGWGHTGPEVTEGLTCDAEQAERWFLLDTHWAVLAVQRAVRPMLLQNQFDALISFTFNVGATSVAHSTLIKYVNVYAWEAAADEFLKWDHQNGVVLAGLTARRAAERAMFVQGSTLRAPSVV